ncbi:DUF1254 domain-containing protein [Paeniglutamicibacter sp. NPDC012692]|uniref:DUF1254 domain-containing protein n=1 Tax=Paeniglutamicibacter sp. NPDC012692 TaxID=3364388 RepID=UPI0036A3AF67
MNPEHSAMVDAAFAYGIPLTFNLDQVQRYVEHGIGANPAAAFNTFSHARTLAGPADTFVSINNDTLYSMAQLDLGVGPVLLEVPDTAGRYYVLQFVDAWTNNFAYVGHRATGTAAGKFLIVPPGWDGQVPENTTLITAPTLIVSIVGRWACNGVSDLPAVHTLQNAATLTQLDSSAVPAGLPVIDAAIAPEVQFLEKLRLYSQAYPPAQRDMPALEALAPLGITEPGTGRFAGMDTAQAKELGDAITDAQQRLMDFLRAGGVPVSNGWQLPYHAFDYNVDFFEVGTFNEPAYTSMPPNERYVRRTAAAIGGLWGNHAYEAAYAPVYVDSENTQLNGANDYVLHLSPTPPVNAFWSLTMYSVPDFYLVENQIKRYSLGDRTEGLEYEADGSLKIYLGSKRPADPRMAANWLPAPKGDFRPMMRMYEPDASIIDGSYEFPAIVRLNGK